MRAHKAALLCALLAVGGCASGAVNLQSGVQFCASRTSGHTEVYVPDARVVRVLGDREGRSGMHEGFIIRAAARTFKVEDNVDITGPIPLHAGDAVSLLGQLECDDYVIHWTHRDPSGRHMSGYVKVNGAVYE